MLDVGLAKALDAHGSGATAEAMNSPTITSPAHLRQGYGAAGTEAGMILGTAAYMAPEQAKGRPVDRRADIWAFGVVLFEMLTGTRAFGGDDVAESLANVLKTEPAWERLPADVPARIRQVLRSSLQRDAKQRLGDMQSVRLALEGAFETAAPQPTSSVTASASRGRLPWMVAAAAAVVGMAALAIPAVQHLREAPPPPPAETRTEIATPATDRPTDFVLSPDGRQIVFVASGDGPSRLWRRSLATTTAQPLAGTDGALSPFWSPDSRTVGFFANGQLKRIDLSGGAPQTVATASNPRGGTWNADGVILFAPTSGGGLLRVPALGGPPVAATTLAKQQAGHRLPSFLPDGRHFLFYVQGAPDSAGIYLGTLDAPDTHRLTAADASGVYRASPSVREDGWLLWVRGGTLVAQRLDVARAALTGDPVTLADRVAVDSNLNAGAVSVSASGLVAYRTGAGSRQLTWVDRTGQALGPLGAPDENDLRYPRASRDRQRVAVARTVEGNMDLWLLDGPRKSRFTFDAAPERDPLWSPDGTRIAFDSNRTGPRDLYSARPWQRQRCVTFGRRRPAKCASRSRRQPPIRRSISPCHPTAVPSSLSRRAMGCHGSGCVPSTRPRRGHWQARKARSIRSGRLTVRRSGSLRLPSFSGSTSPAAVTRVERPRQTSHRAPHFLPDGQRFLFSVRGTPEVAGIYLGSLDGRAPTRLTAADSGGGFLPPDRVVYMRQGTLVARRLDLSGAILTGDPVTLADRVGLDGLLRGGCAVSGAGLVAYRVGGYAARQFAWLDRTGKAVGVAGEPDANGQDFPELAPDDRRVAMRRTVNGNGDVWLLDLLRGGMTRATFDADLDSNPVWSPDGLRIAFGAIRAGVYDLYVKPSDGSGAEVRLVESAGNKAPQDWSKDGRWLAYYELNPATGRDSSALDMTSPGRPPRVVANTPANELLAQFSPDGRWVAYQTNESGRFEVVVQPFPDGGGKWQVSTSGGVAPRWRADGRELYFIARDAAMMAVPVTAAGPCAQALRLSATLSA